MSEMTTTTRTTGAADEGLREEVSELAELESRLRESLRAGRARAMPGNAFFLEDGRVLCRDRARGDSRYPYGVDGFHFWVHASGRMHGNRGMYYPFLPSAEGQTPPIAFFLGIQEPDGGYRPFSLLPVPFVYGEAPDVLDRYTVFGPDAAYFSVRTPDLSGFLRVLVIQSHPEHTDVAFSVLIESRSQTAQALFCSSYFDPFFRHQLMETCEDRWFKRVWVDDDGPGAASALSPPFLITVNEDVSRFQSVTNYAMLRRALDAPELRSETCTSQAAYIGDARLLLPQARCLRVGGFARETRLTTFADNAVAADLNRFLFHERGQWARFDYVLTLCGNRDAFEEERRTPITAATVDRAARTQRARCAEMPHLLRLHFGESRHESVSEYAFQRFLPLLIRQVAVCAETRGFMQPSPNSLIGFRDVTQAIEGHLHDRPEQARKRILEALRFVQLDGRCPRQYSLPINGNGGQADLREFVDQGAWAVTLLHTYVAVTGDAAILDEEIGYHEIRGTRLETIEQRGSVLDHLIRIMAYLADHRDPETKLVRALYGDWNDAVDGLGTAVDPNSEFGSGVSIMVSLQLYQNCREMIDLLEAYYPGRFLDARRGYQELRQELETALREHAVVTRGAERRIVHGWGDRRGYYVGSFQDSDGQARDSLTSNAFWVISGMLETDVSLKPHVLAAMERLDSPYGMRTFTPGFAPDGPGVGRVGKLPIGTAENAGVYVHATAFGIAALFLMDEPRRAWNQILKILPFMPHHTGLSHSPFVLPNSYILNEQLNLNGQNMNDWQTGSSNVLLKLLIRHVFGFNPGLDGLHIRPARWSPFGRNTINAVTHGRRVRIQIQYGTGAAPRFLLNERPLVVRDARPPEVVIPYAELDPSGKNLIEAWLPQAD